MPLTSNILDPANWHPFCLDVEVTQRCGVGCKFCYLGKPGVGCMSDDTANLVLDYLADQITHHPIWRWSEINLYGGEPFLNFPIVQHLAIGALVGRRRSQITIFTNGATATTEQIGWCIEHGVVPKRSTAGCPEAASLTRPGDYTDRWVAEGLFWQDFTSTHRLTVTPETAPYLARSVRWLHSQGFYGPVDIATDDYAAWPPAAMDALEDEIGWLAGEFVWQFRQGRMLAIENFTQIAKAMFEQAGVMVMGCGAGWNTQGITWDGRIVACHRCFREPPESALHGGRLCDILSGSQVRFGERYAKWLHDTSKGIESTKCAGCEARQVCQHGCLHVSCKTGSDCLSSPDSRCRFVRCLTKSVRWINQQLSALGAEWWKRSACPCRPFSEEE